MMGYLCAMAGPRVLDEEYENPYGPAIRILIIFGTLIYGAFKFASRPKEPNGKERDGRGCVASIVTFFILTFLFNTVFRSCL